MGKLWWPVIYIEFGYRLVSELKNKLSNQNDTDKNSGMFWLVFIIISKIDLNLNWYEIDFIFSRFYYWYEMFWLFQPKQNQIDNLVSWFVPRAKLLSFTHYLQVARGTLSVATLSSIENLTRVFITCCVSLCWLMSFVF